MKGRITAARMIWVIRMKKYTYFTVPVPPNVVESERRW
jgi:hypothetical protein